MRTHRLASSGLLAATAAALTLAGCSSSGSSASPTQPSVDAKGYDCAAPTAPAAPIKATALALPIVSNGALFAGVDQGTFSKHGIDLSIQPMANPAAGISAVQGGTANFAFSTTVSLLQAIDNGVKISIVAPFAGIAPQYYDKMKAGEEGYTKEVTAIVAAKGIDSLKALDGKTVAVADVKGQSELTTRYVLKEAGVDPAKVKYTVMAFPDGLNAFKAGKVDAVFTVDPFLTQAVAAGGTILPWPGVETFHEGPTSAIIASNDFIAKNADTVVRFNCAMREANTYANANPDAIRAEVAKQQKVDPATLAKATVPYFYASADVQNLTRFKDIMKEQGFLKKDLNVTDVIIPQAIAGS